MAFLNFYLIPFGFVVQLLSTFSGAQYLERYRSGHNEPHSKCGRPFTGAWVRIPLSPLDQGQEHWPCFFVLNLSIDISSGKGAGAFSQMDGLRRPCLMQYAPVLCFCFILSRLSQQARKTDWKLEDSERLGKHGMRNDPEEPF